MDFDFTTETITPDTTNVLTIGGTGGLELSVGNTAARPGSPQNGLIRYNSTSETIECFVSNSWASSMAPIKNQAVVQKSPGAGEFGSIAAACASITDASAENLWEVLVGPGVYIEPEIVVPEYVNITGIDEYDVMVKPDANNHHVFVMAKSTTVSFLTIDNAGPGFAAIAFIDVGEYALCHKVAVTNSDIGFLISSSTIDSIVYLEYCDADGGTTGISVTSTNGFTQHVNLENFYIYSNPVTGLYASGPDTRIDIQAFGFEGDDGTNTGLLVEDGAIISAKAGHINNWDIGAHMTDNGDPTHVEFLGCAFDTNTTWDLYSQHISATGLLAGQARKDFVNAMASPGFVSAFSDPAINAFVQTGSFFMGSTQENLTDVTELIIDTPPVGLVTGGTMSVVSGLTLNVAAGTGYLRKDGYMTRVQWSSTNLTLPAGTLPYIYVDDNSTVQYSLSVPNPLTTVLLGRSGTNATNIYALGPLSVNITNYGNKVEEWLRATVGPVFVSGSIVTENGSTPRAVDVTAGSWYYGTQHRLPSAKTAPTITDTYKSGGVLTFASITQIPNDTYDNGTNLVSLTTGYFTKHVLYQSSEGAFQAYTLVHGQDEYPTQDDALQAPLPNPYIDPGPTPKIAAIIVQQGVNSLIQIVDERPIFFGASGTGTSGTDIHGDLLGLDADDHPQYLLVDGTRAMTGDLSMGTHDLTSVGTINGVTIETHASRHQPNGADPIPTGSAVTVSTSTINGAGTSNSLSRADHTHALSGVQPLDATLTALAAYNTNGLLTQTAADTFTGRTLTGTTNRLSVTNGNGVSGNPTIDIDAAYVGQTSITTLGTIATGTWSGTTIATANGGTGLTSIGTANQVLGVNAGATGLEYKTVTAGSGITVTNGVSSITIAATNSGTVTSVAASGSTGLTVGGSPITSSGTLTFTLDTGLQNLATYATTGLVTATGTDTWASRTITAGSGVSVTNGDGVAGNPTIANTGVLSNIAGTGITVSGATGNVTITNAGVTSFNAGTTGFTPSSATTGAITLAGTLNAVNGGTGQTSYVIGDLLYANSTTTLAKLADVATGNALISGGVNTAPSWGKIGLTTHVSGTLGTGNGGTGLSAVGTANQILGMNAAATGLEYKTVIAGTGITVTPSAGALTIAAINNGTVTSVGLSLPSIFSVSGSPVTTSGTLTGTLATQSANTFLVGPISGAAAAPTFRLVGIDELSDVVITTPAANQVIAYNGTNWVNTGAVGSNASGLIGVGQAGAAAWTLVSGNTYRADFTHNLGTTNYTITIWDTNDNSVVGVQNTVATNTNTVRITVVGNTKTLRVVVVANGQSIVAGGSTPSSVITAKDGVTISATATKLNFTGQAVGVTDAGSGTTNINIGSRFTFFAASLDTPVNSDFAINSLAPMVADPTYASLNVRSFSNTTEQGVAYLVSIPTGATTMTVKIRGRAQTAPGVASVVQPRMYFRLLPNNSAVGAWSAAQELANISIPTNANFQYSTQTISLATFGLTAGNLYQVEITRRTAGVTGTNLAANFLLAELTVEFA